MHQLSCSTNVNQSMHRTLYARRGPTTTRLCANCEVATPLRHLHVIAHYSSQVQRHRTSSTQHAACQKAPAVSQWAFEGVVHSLSARALS